MKLELFVKIRNGETLTLTVYPSISIYDIKIQIFALKEIDVDDQVLTLNGSILENDLKMSRNQIENSIVWLSYRSKEISIHIFEDSSTKKETINLEIEWTEKISEIKSMIAEKKDIPQHVQHLYLGHESWSETIILHSWSEKNKLRDFESLQDNRISKKASKVGLSLMLCGTIYVHDDSVDASNRNLKVEVEAYETIKEVKAKINAIQYNQRQKQAKRSKFFGTNLEPTLYIAKSSFDREAFAGLEPLYDDEKTVYEYGLKNFFELEFLMTKSPSNYSPKDIFVKMLDGKTKICNCFSFTTIETFKLRLQEKEGIPPDEQRLIFNGGQLDNNERTMEEYNIKEGSTLHLVLRLLGE